MFLVGRGLFRWRKNNLRQRGSLHWQDSLLSPAATATLPDPEDVAEQCQAVVEAMLASVEWCARASRCDTLCGCRPVFGV